MQAAIWILVFVVGGITNMEGPYTQEKCVELKSQKPAAAKAHCVNSQDLNQKIL